MDKKYNPKIYCIFCSDKKYQYDNVDLYPPTEGIVYLIKKTGPFGNFLGCPNFPKCKYSVRLEPKKHFIDYDDELRPY